MTSQKKIIITIFGVILVAALAVAAWLWRPVAVPPVDNQPVVNKPLKTSLPGAPAFLDEAEQAQVGIATDSPVQIFSDASGDNVVYKIIKSDSDVVDDPEAVGSMSPQKKLPTAR